jgi:hypothetical protein
MTLISSRSSTVRVLAPQPSCRCVDGSRRLPPVVEVAQVLPLPVVADSSSPLAAELVPAHAHELRRALPVRYCHCCRLVILRQQRTSLLCSLHLPFGGEVQPQPLPSYSSAVRVLASQPPRRRVDCSRRLVLVVEGAQVIFLAIVVDQSLPLAVQLVPTNLDGPCRSDAAAAAALSSFVSSAPLSCAFSASSSVGKFRRSRFPPACPPCASSPRSRRAVVETAQVLRLPIVADSSSPLAA